LATVADNTFAVIFGDPAEFGEEAAAGAGAADVATAGVSVTVADFAMVVTFEAVLFALCPLLATLATFAVVWPAFGFAPSVVATLTFIVAGGAVLTAGAGVTFAATG
jgi:hypothetical protein